MGLKNELKCMFLAALVHLTGQSRLEYQGSNFRSAKRAVFFSLFVTASSNSSSILALSPHIKSLDSHLSSPPCRAINLLVPHL